MITNPLMLLSLLTSAFIAFFLGAISIEIIVRLFKIKNHRLRSSLRLFPFLNLIFDFMFSKYSISYWVNPLSCASCAQKFYLGTFFPQLNSYLSTHQISLIRYLGENYHHTMYTIVLITLALVSAYFVLRQLIQTISLTRYVHSIIKKSQINQRPIENIQLARELIKHRIKIYVSNAITIPLAFYKGAIIIPKTSIDILNQDEFEAVIAHEFEHIKCHDPFIRLFYRGVATLFWWIPTDSWIRKIEKDQELACDHNVLKYGFKEASIATALFKVAKQIKNYKCKENSHSLCYLLDETNPTKVRIKSILGLLDQKEEKISKFYFALATISLGFLLTCFF
jgi:beta-lactamase regulating signal transducer with metallopeptidase domain